METPSTPRATLATLLLLGGLRSDQELQTVRTALRARNVAGYRRGLARLLASDTLRPQQAAAVRAVLGPVMGAGAA